MGIGALVCLARSRMFDMWSHVNERTLGLKSSAYVLEHEDVPGTVEGLGGTKSALKMRFSVGSDAERRPNYKEWIGATGVFGNVHLGEKLHAVSHRYAEL